VRTYEHLCGKKALITGASGGLGRELALLLAAVGCNIHLLGRNCNKLENLSNDIKELYLDLDVKYDSLDFTNTRMVSDFVDKIGDYDVLINCAGIFPIKNLCESTLEDYNQCFDVNVKIPFILSNALAPGMKKRGWGRIVNVASSSAYNGSADTGLYCASKHALLGLSRSLYQELKPYGIRTYTVSPGSIQTDMGATDTRQDFSTFLDPKEVAEYILFIVSYHNELIAEEVRLNRVLVR